MRKKWIAQQDKKYNFSRQNLLGIAGLLKNEIVPAFINGFDHLTILGTEASINSFLVLRLNKNLELKKEKLSTSKLLNKAFKRKIITEELKDNLIDLGKKLDPKRYDILTSELLDEAFNKELISEELKEGLTDLGKAFYRMPSTSKMIIEAFNKELITEELKEELLDFVLIRHSIIHSVSLFASMFLGSKTDGDIPHYWEGNEATEIINVLMTDPSKLDKVKPFQYAKEGLQAYFQLITQVKLGI